RRSSPAAGVGGLPSVGQRKALYSLSTSATNLPSGATGCPKSGRRNPAGARGAGFPPSTGTTNVRGGWSGTSSSITIRLPSGKNRPDSTPVSPSGSSFLGDPTPVG